MDKAQYHRTPSIASLNRLPSQELPSTLPQYHQNLPPRAFLGNPLQSPVTTLSKHLTHFTATLLLQASSSCFNKPLPTRTQHTAHTLRLPASNDFIPSSDLPYPNPENPNRSSSSFVVRRPRHLKTDFSNVQSSAASLETCRPSLSRSLETCRGRRVPSRPWAYGGAFVGWAGGRRGEVPRNTERWAGGGLV